VKRDQPEYLSPYRSLKLSRDAQGILVVEFHSNCGPLKFTTQDHTEFVDNFYRISQDRANKIYYLEWDRRRIRPRDRLFSVR